MVTVVFSASMGVPWVICEVFKATSHQRSGQMIVNSSLKLTRSRKESDSCHQAAKRLAPNKFNYSKENKKEHLQQRFDVL
jgi:hypothetical protein